jgi:4-amino-4-deoxy-L-arabinose transferase-like glycosyltransferase
MRAGLAVWGGWLLVTGAVFSLMAGIFHAYYTVALAPAVAALVGIGAGLLWPRRASVPGAAVLAGAMLVTTGWSFILLTRTATAMPAVRWTVLVTGLAASVGLALSGALGARLRRTVAALAIVAALAGPAAYSLDTATTAHTGSLPTAGPSTGGAGGSGGFGGQRGGPPPSGATARGAGGATGGSTSSGLIALLEKNAGSYTWVAATTGSQSAAGYQLATREPVMAIGGFNGGDNSPTLAQFQADVAAGTIHYYVSGGGGGGRAGGQGSASQIASWVAQHYTPQTVGGVTVYDLTS